MRLDVYLTDRGLTKSRSLASECIKKGLVSVNGTVKTKPSVEVSDGDAVELLGIPHNFVGRGGLKLEGALDAFEVDVSGMRCVDIGASTGGFTDCLLKHGADFVLAVDSGHGQLDKSLEDNIRVKSLEGFNARYLTPNEVGFYVDIAVSDVSFISQTLILGAAYSVLKDNGIYIGLVKPQFECGPSALNKNGIVKDKKQHKLAVLKVAASGADVGFSVSDIAKSPISGGDGNSEFLIYMIKTGRGEICTEFHGKLDEVCL